MKYNVITPDDVAALFTLSLRPDTHDFIKRDLPDHLKRIQELSTVKPFRSSIASLKSGEYIKKASYSEAETDYVYLTIGQFSGEIVTFDDLTFLDPIVGVEYERIALAPGDIVVTRSGTVGVVHVFYPPDDKIYIPSHHLAIVRLKDRTPDNVEYHRLILQSDFARDYFWAFASGKGQKEISNWSIRSVPVPGVEDPSTVVKTCLDIEAEIAGLKAQIEALRSQKEKALELETIDPAVEPTGD